MAIDRRIYAGVWLVAIAGAAYLLRPLLHPYIMSVWKEPLGTLMLTVAAVLLLRSGWNYSKIKISEVTRGVTGRQMVYARAFVIELALGLVLFGGALAYKMAVQDVRMARAFKTFTFTDTNSLPETGQNRLVPLPVAERFGADSLQSPTELAYDWHPQLWDGKFSWVSGLTPNGGLRYWLDKAAGVQVVDATTTQRKSDVVAQEFKLSEGVGLTDNIRWKLYKRDYLADIPEVFYGKVDGKVVAVAPVMKYQGWLIKYPVVDGAFVVAADGSIERLSLEQAKQHPAVKSAGRLYPEQYVRFVHESYAYKRGILNKWFRHVDQTEISDPAGESNAQPYMLHTKDGLVWLSAADPWGKSFGIYKIFITNAVSGETKLYSIDHNAAFTGAAQAVGYVKSARPQYNWETGNAEDGKSGNILAIEPRPVFVSNVLYWMVSVTTSEAKGVNETCFINAKNNQVNCMANEAETVAFIASGAKEISASAGAAGASGAAGSGAAGADGNTSLLQPAPTQPGSSNAGATTRQQKIERLEQTLRQALLELEELKKSQ